MVWSFKKKAKLEVDDETLKKQLDALLVLCYDNLSRVDEDLIKKAFYFNYISHKDQIRKSGEPYYVHPIEVAKIVVKEMPLDDFSVAAALLHDVVAISKKYNHEDIKSEFGTQISDIIMGLSTIKSIENHDLKHFENYRRLLLSWFKDVRIILIKLADRLHNLQTLEHISPEKQKLIAEETLELYSPFAHRFGLANIKWALEDYSFKFLHKEIYEEISNKLQLSRSEREQYIIKFIDSLKPNIKEELDKHNVRFKIYGRAKHIYSIYNKTILRQKSIDELYDLFAIRIIIDSDNDSLCHKVYDIVTAIYEPMPDTLKDYVTEPKKNGYQSIHTGVVGFDNQNVEVQIRTKKMHEFAEKGVAAHFIYKRGALPENSILDSENLKQWMGSVRSVFENIKGEFSETQFTDIKKNLFFDEVYVFTPSNEFRILPKKSTPLDFAYAIHTEIGLHCIGAKVNGHIVPLSYRLISGDQVEIITSKKHLPKTDWLKMCITHRAHYYIQKSLNEQLKENIKKGKSIWKDMKKKFVFQILDDEFIPFLNHIGYKDEEDFFIEIIDPEYDFLTLKNSFIAFKNDKNGNKNLFKTLALKEVNSANNPFLGYNDENNLPVEFSKCCYPIPDDEIICIQNNEHIYSIHRINCHELKNLPLQKLNVFKVDWSILKCQNFTTKLIIHGEENPTLLGNISNAITNMPELNIRGFKFDNYDKTITAKAKLVIKDKNQFDNLIENLKNIEGIISVDRE
jgi:guanosine-3',5'-bis(diphosphate) 3'-pyrophosphohydrolase